MGGIKSHLQPKYFLRGFLCGKQNELEEDSVFVYRKGLDYTTNRSERKENNPYKAGVENIAFVKNFYAFLKDDGSIDPLKYERRLEHEIEHPGNKVLEKIRNFKLSRGEVRLVRDFLSEDEQIRFSRYVASMCCRNKRARKQFEMSLQTTIEQAQTEGYLYSDIAKNIPSEEKERLDKWLDSVNPEFDKVNGKLSPPETFLKEFNAEKQNDESFLLEFLNQSIFLLQEF